MGTYASGDEPVPGYRLVNLLGRGGFGEVWKATAPGKIHVAVKIINLSENKQGIKEFRAIRLVKLIRHPNLVPIIAFWIKDNRGHFIDDSVPAESIDAAQAQADELIIAMGLGDKNLFDRFKECQKEGRSGIPPEELLDYLEDSAKAIDFLNQPTHDLGSGPIAIQHCDIKPQNILIVGGAVQVCDFGLARVLGPDARATVAGWTPAYMAPELLLEGKPSKWTDQYSLAVSFCELRTGVHPIPINSPAQALMAHVEGKINLSLLSDPERDVIKKATAVKPHFRYPTTLDMVKALRRACPDLHTSGIAPCKISLDELLHPGAELIPGYKLVRLLGRGSYGEVWEATAPGNIKWALKVIRSLEGLQGRQEYKALELIKNLSHNHLMEVYAYWLLDTNCQVIPDEIRREPNARTPAALVIASKLGSKNLLQRLQECQMAGHRGIPNPELLVYMRQAGEAIDYLNAPVHFMGERQVSILHRDIKPENILLVGNAVKVADFGLAKVVEGTSAAIRSDSAGFTVAYAAPEMFTGKITAWTDQYSLAMSYYRLRTGSMPFTSMSSPHQLVMQLMEGRIDLGGLPEPERAVIAIATRLKPEERYPDCTSMVMALEQACGYGGPPDESASGIYRSSSGFYPRPQLATPTGHAGGTPTGLVKEAENENQTVAQVVVPSHESSLYGATVQGLVAPQTQPQADLETRGDVPAEAITPASRPTTYRTVNLPPIEAPAQAEPVFVSAELPAIEPVEDDAPPEETDDPFGGIQGAHAVTADPGPETIEDGSPAAADAYGTNYIPKVKAPAPPKLKGEAAAEADAFGASYLPSVSPTAVTAQTPARTKAPARTPKAPAPVPVARPRAPMSKTTRAVLLTGLAAGLLIALAAGGWLVASLTIAGQVDGHSNDGEYVQAIDKMESSSWFLVGRQSGLWERLRTSWRQKADKQLENQQYEALCQDSQKLLERCEKVTSAAGLCQEIEGVRGKVETAWLAQVDADLQGADRAEAYVQALHKVQRAQVHFPKSAPVRNKEQEVLAKLEGAFQKTLAVADRHRLSGQFVACQQALDQAAVIGETPAMGLQVKILRAFCFADDPSATERQKYNAFDTFDSLLKSPAPVIFKQPGLPTLADAGGRYLDLADKQDIKVKDQARETVEMALKRMADGDDKAQLAKGLSRFRTANRQRLLEQVPAKPEDALAILDWALRFSATDGEKKDVKQWRATILLDSALALLGQDKLEACLVRVSEAGDDLDAALKIRSDALRACVALRRGPKEERRKALPDIERLLPAAQLAERTALSVSLADVAAQEPELLHAFLTTFERVRKLIPSSDPVVGRLDDLRSKRFDKLIKEAEALESKPKEALLALAAAEEFAFNHKDDLGRVTKLRDKLDKSGTLVKLNDMLKAAAALLEKADYKKCRDQAREGRDQAKAHKDLERQFRALLVLATVKDKDSGVPELVESVKQFQLLVKEKPYRLADLCVAIESRIDGKSITWEAVSSSFTLASAASSGNDKLKIDDLVDKRTGAGLAQLVKDMLKALDDRTLKDKELETAKQKIKTARTKAPADRQLLALEALVLAEGAATQEEAFILINNQLSAKEAPLLAGRLVKTFARLAVLNKKSLPDTKKTIRSTLQRPDAELSPEAKQEIRAAYRTFLVDFIKDAIAEPKPKWAELLSDCRDADASNAWVNAALAECLIEKNGGDPQEGDLSQAETAVQKDLQGAGEYGRYVRGLVKYLREKKFPSEAAKDVFAAYDKGSPLLLVEQRRLRASEILQNAANKQVTRKANPFRRETIYASEGNAVEAHQWLRLAYDLSGKKADPILNASLAVAENYQKKPDPALVRKLLAAVPLEAVEHLKEDDFPVLPFLVVKVKHSKELEMVRPCVLILDRLDAAKQELPPEDMKDIYDQVVKPGCEASIKVDDKSEVGLRKQVAKLCGRKANMLGFYEEIGGKNPNYKEISELFDRALRLNTDGKDKDRADYFAGRGFAVALRSYAASKPIDEKPMEDDFNEAKRLDPACPFPYLYRGAYLHMIRTGKAKTAGEKRGLLEQAVKEYAQAIDTNERGPDVSPERSQQFTLLINHSNALVQLAHLDHANHSEHLKLAVASATKAVELESSRSPEIAYAFLGIALEDLALLGQTEMYKKAIAYFEEARKRDEKSQPIYSIHLARGKYRSAEYAQPNPQFLQEASTMLKRAVASIQSMEPDKQEEMQPQKAQALYYQGKIQAALEQYDEADKAFGGAMTLVKDPHAKEFAEMAQIASAELSLKRAARLKGKGKEADEFLKTARKRADELKEANPREAARIRGLAFEIKSAPVEALKEFDTELKSKPQAREPDIKLAVARLYLLLDVRWLPKLGDSRPKPTELVLQARALLKLCGETFLDALLRGEVHGLVARAELDAVDIDNPTKQKAQRQAAIDELLQAARLTPLHQANGWRWRYELAFQYHELIKLENDQEKKKGHRTAALRWVKEAKDGMATGTDKQLIQKLLDSLEP